MAMPHYADGGQQILWSLGELMWKARKDAGLDQQAVAEHIGVSRALVGHWENDRSEPSYRRLAKFAQLTGFPLAVLLSAIGYKSNNAGEAPDLTVHNGKRKGPAAKALPFLSALPG